MTSMADRQEVPEIGKGVRRHRSDVLRRPRTNKQSLSPVVHVKETSFVPTCNNSSPSKEPCLNSPFVSSHLLRNPHRNDAPEVFRVENGHWPAALRSSEEHPEVLHQGDVQEHSSDGMEKGTKDIVYVRRGDCKDKPFNRKGDGKSIFKTAKEGDKSDENWSRKRDAKDMRSAERADAPKASRQDQVEDDVDAIYGNYGSRSEHDRGRRAEKSWKEISEREGKNKFLKMKRSAERGDLDRKESFQKERSLSVVRFKSGENCFKAGEGKLPTKLKLKVGGVLQTLHADTSRSKPDLAAVDVKRCEKKISPPPSTDKSKRRRHRLILQDNSDEDEPLAPKMVQLHQKPPVSKDTNALCSPNPTSKSAIEQPSTTEPSVQALRKSSRVPKKKVLEDYEDDIPDEDSKAAWKGSLTKDDDSERCKEDDEYEEGGHASDRDVSEDDDEDLEEDSDDSPKPKKQRSQALNGNLGKAKPSVSLTARQRTLQISKDGDADAGANLIEFPTGLTHSRKGRERLTEEERQVRRAEAALRRKQLVAKTEKEIQATAIQKILGQDSSRKRKEDKLQKQRDEIEQGRKAAALEPASNSIRWSMGPGGTVVSWSQDVQLPTIFTSGPTRYPPAREKCAAPTCENVYKYRDSKSSLPLCSLQCYRTIQPSQSMISA